MELSRNISYNFTIPNSKFFLERTFLYLGKWNFLAPSLNSYFFLKKYFLYISRAWKAKIKFIFDDMANFFLNFIIFVKNDFF